MTSPSSSPSQVPSSRAADRDSAALHRVLFPIGPRQESLLAQLGPTDTPASAFLAFHRGIAQALELIVTKHGARGRVKDWLLARKEGLASEMLWGGDPMHAVSQTSRQSFLHAAEAAVSLGEAYCTVTAPDLRHRLGEHYTPRWLVEKIVGETRIGGVVADPACGDGRFLVALLQNGHDQHDVWGADLNPVAVVMARLSVWLYLGRPAAVPSVQIRWADFILGGDGADAPPVLAEAARNIGGLPPASVYLGNPPWVTWRNMSDDYREAVAERTARSRLHHARGWAARVSAGQADLSHVFVHDAIERVETLGRLAFVLPRTTFKAPVGPARLREGESTSGRKYRFAEVWDCIHSDPFTGVRTDAVVSFIEVDEPNVFPVPWREASPGTPSEERVSWASPSDPDDPSSPWFTERDADAYGPLRLNGGERWSGLRARGGINTGGGNGVFHVEVVSRRGRTVTIRNLPSRRQPVEVTTADVESRYLRPLLRGRDVGSWRAKPSGHIVLPHDPNDLRRPVAEDQLAHTAPLTYAYLLRYRELLASRKELHRWKAVGWYTLFRIGQYTAQCWRVVWPHSANGQLRAAVLPPDDRAVPDQKVVLLPFDDAEPAMFMCALLNCRAVRRAASRSAGIDASPNLVRRLVLPRFDPTSPKHQAIVELARQAANGTVEAQEAVDGAASDLYLH